MEAAEAAGEMIGILFLIPIALGLGLLGLIAFFWAVGHGQFEDLDGAALRIFIEDAATPEARTLIDEDDNASP
jgi:cbb3-type cytochrome oxidase maturation protein